MKQNSCDESFKNPENKSISEIFTVYPYNRLLFIRIYIIDQYLSEYLGLLLKKTLYILASVCTRQIHSVHILVRIYAWCNELK